MYGGTPSRLSHTRCAKCLYGLDCCCQPDSAIQFFQEILSGQLRANAINQQSVLEAFHIKITYLRENTEKLGRDANILMCRINNHNFIL